MALSNYLWYGWHDEDVTATTSAQATYFDSDDKAQYAYNLSIKNTGSVNDLVILPLGGPMTEADLTGNNGVAIPAGDSFSFAESMDHAENRRIVGFAYIALADTTTFTINAS